MILSAVSCVSGPRYDVALVATPIAVKSLAGGGSTDAVVGKPGAFEKPTAKVVFHIDRIITGEFSQRQGGPSIIRQISDSVKNKDFLQTFNYTDPDKALPRELISIAVADPAATFGITSWDNPEKKRHVLYLQKAVAKGESYYLVKSR